MNREDKIKKLKKDYKSACNAYLKEFCIKHGFDYNEALLSWEDSTGDIVLCGDFFVSLDDIITDINEDAPEIEYIKYYDYCMDIACLGIEDKHINYRSWLHGAPRYDSEALEDLKEIKRNFIDSIKEVREKLKNESKY